jgi:MFS superfamily sulfate permease-like transporter
MYGTAETLGEFRYSQPHDTAETLGEFRYSQNDKAPVGLLAPLDLSARLLRFKSRWNGREHAFCETWFIVSRNTVKSDFLASVVVFLVALPLCMGIALASGVPVAAGLITGIVGGIVVGMLAGCPLQVSGPAAGLSVIIYEVVLRFGLETLGIIVLLAGLIQVVAGLLRLGQWFRAVSPAVIKGMLSGIGVLIFASQFHVMVDDKPKGSGIENLVTIPSSVMKAVAVPDSRSREAREFHLKMLQQVGELHRSQVDVQQSVAEIFPHVHDPELEYTEAQKKAAQVPLAAIAKRQKELGESLGAVVDELQTTEGHLASEEQAQAVLEAAAAAQSQLQVAGDSFSEAEPEALLAAQDESVARLQDLLDQLKNHHIAAHLGIVAIGVILLWQFAPAKVKFIPAPLVAVVVATVGAAALSLPVFYVEVPDRLWDGVHLPSLALLSNVDFVAVIQTALLVAVVASAETLLCATAVDQLQDGPRTNYDRELFAQGVGNTVCGVLGVLPMTGVIVRSSANIQGGGKTRLSAILHGIWLLIFVAVLGFLLRMIPVACLAAILVYTGFKLIDFKAFRELARYGKSEVAIYAATIVTIVVTDLLTGVLVGVGLAALKLLYIFSHLDARLTVNEQEHTARLDLYGAATFLRLPVVAAKLESVPRGTELHVDFEHLDYIDHACLELFMRWAEQHEKTGGQLVIDWESLHARFRGENDRRNSRRNEPSEKP